MSILSMIMMVVLIGFGERMAERFIPLYITALGGSIYVVGAFNALQNLLGALYSLPGGHLSDKIGYKKALLVFSGIAMTGYLIVILSPTWQAVMIGSVFFFAWSAVSMPAIMSLINQVMPGRQTLGISIHSLVRRIPMAIAPVVGGLIIGLYGMTEGVKIAFMFAFLLCATSLAVQWRLMKEPAKSSEYINLFGHFKNINPALRNLLFSDILIRFAEQIPYAFVVIWVVQNLGFTPVEFGLLTMVEMITATVIYLPVAFWADKMGKKPFVLATFVFFTIFPVVLYYSRSFPLLIVAFLIRGMKEFGEPTRKALIMDLAPANVKAGTFGVYYLLRDLVVSVAAFSSAFLWNISPETNFFSAFACGAIGTILFAIYGRDSNAAPANTKETEPKV
jgi:MFS family permease